MTTFYEIVWSFDRISLQSQIAGLLEKGWQPQGGVCVTVQVLRDGKIETHFYQALIKYDPIVENKLDVEA